MTHYTKRYEDKKIVYKSPSKSTKMTRWFNERDGSENYVKSYNPTIRFEKNGYCQVEELSRVTDYYTWTCTGPVSWTEKKGRYRTVKFSKVGKYTVTSVPHQVTKTEKWKEARSRAYDVFSDGHTQLIKTDYWEEKPHRFYTDRFDRKDLKKTWDFEVTPEEVDKPIPLPDPEGKDPTPPGVKEIKSEDLKWDTQLIQ